MLVDEGLEILDDDECWRLIGTEGLGRVGVSIAALPAIFPVNYAAVDGAIVFRTAAGTKLRAALAHAVVVFEVDHADPSDRSGWSVQVVGVAEPVPEGEEPEGIDPWVAGERTSYVRIRPELLTGRRIVHAG